MMAETSYQRRKQEVQFYRQCCDELEQIVKSLQARLKVHQLPYSLPFLGRKRTDFLTPYNTHTWDGSL